MGRGSLFLVLFGYLGLVAVPASAAEGQAKVPRPVQRIPLAELGFPGYSNPLLRAGASMATVHLLDSTHMLLTYSLRTLVPRLAGDDRNDSDRLVAALLVDVPSGKVMARKTWRMHDHGTYLWDVGRGVFVVRMGENLSVMAPLQSLATGDDAFRRWALPHRPGEPVLVSGSPDGKMITVETAFDAPPELGDQQEPGPRKHYVLEFYRVQLEPKGPLPVRVERAGLVGSAVRIRLTMDGDGYLWAEDLQRGRWQISFNEFGGTQQKLAPVLSSCAPRMTLLSRSQFLVQTCRGLQQGAMLMSYGFDGHENWEEMSGESLQPPVLALAPAAGRFAMSRLVAASTGEPVSGMPEGDPLSQEVRVYQTESGDMLLKVPSAPVMRSAENFALSPDGRVLALLGRESVDIYALPELTGKDRHDLAEAQTMTPPEGFGPVNLGRITRPVANMAAVRDAESAVGSPPAAGGVDGGKAAATAPAPDAGVRRPLAAAASERPAEEAADEKRTRPTLLKPGEKAEFREKHPEQGGASH